MGGFLEGPCRGRKLVKEEDLSADDEYSCGGGGQGLGRRCNYQVLEKTPAATLAKMHKDVNMK